MKLIVVWLMFALLAIGTMVGMDQLMGMTLHQSLHIVLNPFWAMEMTELFILSLFIFLLLLDLLNVWMWKRKNKTS
ncbi:hypothetical protein L3V64_007905 [Geobacillus stearothermophilus]|uniref:hypothetical protein n=1 Tax=Geobacillus stearothermophilus TaxID=1422 RepID=UPI001F3B8070|nr:hypothetical protein [Geobacillus stearothermophilus]MCK7606268.1 hypothetical protein [Geobacillus stearothermophilus]